MAMDDIAIRPGRRSAINRRPEDFQPL